MLASLGSVDRRGRHLIAERCYYPTRFPHRGNVYREDHPRRERLYLPFLARDFDGAVFVDEM